MLAIKIAEVEHLPLQESKRMSMYFDMPYGSHYTHERFQTKNGPAVAVVGAIGSISTGVAMGGFLGGVLIAGGIAAGLGAITGNETLANIGMGLSLVGGISSAFTNAAGEFVNPFTNFGDTRLGGAFSDIGSGFKKFFGDIGGTSDALNAVVGDVSGIAGDAIPDTSASAFTNGLIDDAPSMGVSLKDVPYEAATKAASSSGSKGLLGSITGGDNTDLWSIIKGGVEGYDNYQNRKQQQPFIDSQVDLYDARANQINFETDLAGKRYRNMQAQNVPIAGVNPNAQLYGNSPVEGAPKVAVVMDGQVKYLTTDEFAALQQQGGGLLSSVGGQS